MKYGMAVLCVVVGVLTPRQAIESVDGRTLLLLFGMMGMGAVLGADGFFDRAGFALAAWARTPARLLGGLVWASGTLSALITNDAVCVLGAPLVLVEIKSSSDIDERHIRNLLHFEKDFHVALGHCNLSRVR